MDEDSIEKLECGALLHDIGKVGISENILKKKGKLTEEETKRVQLHTVIGENIVRAVEFFQPCLKIIRNHHEWYNGAGYPDSTRGASIDLGARIVSITDAFDAITSVRPYRNALPLDHAIYELIKGRGRQFDPELVDIFVENKIYSVLPDVKECVSTLSY
jgi:HD-GYP domain-containing protein (c-di-GMP phosphodiesterase class II)